MKKLDEAKGRTSHRLEKLAGYPCDELRAGDYRAITTWNREDDRLIVQAVGHRRNVWDRHEPPVHFAVVTPPEPTSIPGGHRPRTG